MHAVAPLLGVCRRGKETCVAWPQNMKIVNSNKRICSCAAFLLFIPPPPPRSTAATYTAHPAPTAAPNQTAQTPPHTDLAQEVATLRAEVDRLKHQDTQSLEIISYVPSLLYGVPNLATKMRHTNLLFGFYRRCVFTSQYNQRFTCTAALSFGST